MKKNLFTVLFVSAGLFAVSQTRMALYEEFTGETCNPCAATNPGLNTLLLNATNAPKVIAIKWQVPIPSSPTPTWSLYKTDQSDIDMRWHPVSSGGYGYPDSSSATPSTYINSAPSGRMNGRQLNCYGISAASYNHPGNLTAAAISAGQAATTPFAITITPVYNANYTNAVVSVTVQSSAAFTAVGSLVYRLVLVERYVHFATQPGTNGEKDFYDPVRKAYPNANTGTALPGTWTAGQVQTFTINCPIPSYVNDLSQMAFVGFVQDDGNRKIWQAARTNSVGPLPNDVAAVAASAVSFTCATSITPTLAVKNQGSNAITSLTITPSIDGVPQTPFNWTGNIAIGGTSTITLNAYTSTGGSHALALNVTGVSGGDINSANNSASTGFALVQTYFAAPVTEAYAATAFPPTNWLMINADNGTATWSHSTASNPSTSSGSAKYDFYNNSTVGDADELYLPPSNLSAVASPSLTFDVAYAQYSNENDQLEVKVSTDCGTTWATVYSKAGTTLMTSAAQTAAFVPSTPAQWRNEVVALPAAASNNASVLVKFVATSAFGNDMYIDNVNLGTTIVTGIAKNTTNTAGVELYPNPTKGETNISINSTTTGTAKIVVLNALGQMVFNKESALNTGANTIQFDTKDFAAGIYNVMIESNTGSVVKKLTVTK